MRTPTLEQVGNILGSLNKMEKLLEDVSTETIFDICEDVCCENEEFNDMKNDLDRDDLIEYLLEDMTLSRLKRILKNIN